MFSLRTRAKSSPIRTLAPAPEEQSYAVPTPHFLKRRFSSSEIPVNASSNGMQDSLWMPPVLSTIPRSREIRKSYRPIVYSGDAKGVADIMNRRPSVPDQDTYLPLPESCGKLPSEPYYGDFSFESYLDLDEEDTAALPANYEQPERLERPKGPEPSFASLPDQAAVVESGFPPDSESDRSDSPPGLTDSPESPTDPVQLPTESDIKVMDHMFQMMQLMSAMPVIEPLALPQERMNIGPAILHKPTLLPLQKGASRRRLIYRLYTISYQKVIEPRPLVQQVQILNLMRELKP